MTDDPTRGTAVRLTDLHRVYGGVAALDGLTLHIEPGEFVALLGPSGCGKTTALRCLAGLEDPDSGSIEVGGHDLTRVSANKRDMGMVFQAYSLFPHMTARQNVEFGLELRGRDRATRRARTAEMLDLVGLDDARRQVRPPAVRRPAAARRPGPGPGHRAAGAAARRAAVGARRQGAHPAARRDPPHPARGRARPPCSSPTTRRRPSRSPTGSA